MLGTLKTTQFQPLPWAGGSSAPPPRLQAPPGMGQHSLWAVPGPHLLCVKDFLLKYEKGCKNAIDLSSLILESVSGAAHYFGLLRGVTLMVLSHPHRECEVGRHPARTPLTAALRTHNPARLRSGRGAVTGAGGSQCAAGAGGAGTGGAGALLRARGRGRRRLPLALRHSFGRIGGGSARRPASLWPTRPSTRTWRASSPTSKVGRGVAGPFRAVRGGLRDGCRGAVG